MIYYLFGFYFNESCLGGITCFFFFFTMDVFSLNKSLGFQGTPWSKILQHMFKK